MTQYLWRWWKPGDPETGLLGFHTRRDRDGFEAGKPGPFRRRVADDGRTTSVTETWDGLVQRLCDRAGIPRIPKHQMN